MHTNFQVVALAAGILVLLYVHLTVLVIRRRQEARIPFKDGGDKLLLARIRAHANFAEYTPLFLGLMIVACQLGMSVWLTAVLAGLFIFGRAVHAYGLLKEHITEHRNLKGRISGMGLTLSVLTILAVYLVYYGF